MLSAAAALSGCGSGSAPSIDAGSTGSGVAANRPVNSLTAAERNQVCDWFATRLGGYGMDPCPGLGLGAPPTQAACLASFPTCSATVGQLEPCVERLIQVETECTPAAESAAVSSPECQVAPCFAF